MELIINLIDLLTYNNINNLKRIIIIIIISIILFEQQQIILADRIVLKSVTPMQNFTSGLPTLTIGTSNYQFHSNKFQPCDKTRQILTEAFGEIMDGPIGVNYTQDSHCEWLIKAQNSSQFIQLIFNNMGTECSYDYVYVYDGDSFNSKLLGSFSGKTSPQKLVAKSGNMLVLLYSDTNYVLDGFRATYYISNCLNNCNSHGQCIGHQCVCHGEYIGPDCENFACPDNCGENEGRGKCVKGLCVCNDNYTGRLCDLKSEPEGGNWRWLANASDGMTSRAAHTAVYIEEQDSLYVYGGYDLNNVLSSLEIYRFSKSRWEDEWGGLLRSHQHLHKIDNRLLKAVLSNTNDDGAKRWGLKKDVSFFKNILYTLAETNLANNVRKQRSTDPLNLNLQLAFSSNNMSEMNVADILDDILETGTVNRPAGRYAHAMEIVSGGFVIFGGKLSNGSFSNELWYYNITSGEWMLRAVESKFNPPKLARHTLTLADDNYLYVFGGSLETGEFSSRIFRIKLAGNSSVDQWEEIHSRGGKSFDLRLVAHSTVYYRYTNSLIVYGGIMTSLARFSKLSDRIYAFQLDKFHWAEILYPRTALRDHVIPRERAFHSAILAGNYMVIFGGYTHRHNKEEICYDNQMYLYHLGCHTWVNQEINPSNGAGNYNQYPKKQGVFAHAAAVRLNNTLLIVGGYHGNVNSDLFAYELPRILRVRDPNYYNPENFCRYHLSQTSCLSDPECGWCSADTICYGRTTGANCTTNLQTTRCPGICPSLGDCHACLVHGTKWQPVTNSHSIATKLGLNQCTWCVQNARCHHKDSYGVCGETESQIPGWWGPKGLEIEVPNKCTANDRRPGLTYVKYNYPVNFTQPDFVSIVNATMVDFAATSSSTIEQSISGGDMIARLLGYVRPPKSWGDLSNEMLHICTSYAIATLKSGLGNTLNTTKEIASITTTKHACKEIDWPSLSHRFLVDFQAKRKVGLGGYKDYHKTTMELQHYNSVHMNSRAFTFEYLEPYSFGSCADYTNCLQCLSDSACGWCDLRNECLQRTVNETMHCSDGNLKWKYLTIQPFQCSNCSNYITCTECLLTGVCEWMADEAKCGRIGRSQNAIRNTGQCPSECRSRESCADCLNEKGRCVWCEATSTCFSFSIYTSEYQFGLCREWLDKGVPQIHSLQDGFSSEDNIRVSTRPQKCKSCSHHRNCTTCLQTLNCGWCFNSEIPIVGRCVQGDFSNPKENCSIALNTTSAKWAYHQCPDVDECSLKLDNCHEEAICTNTHGSYECHCRRGYIGNGRVSCVRTCYELCIHGKCSNYPDYKCKCDLGWTGPDCSQNCGCYNHSTCNERPGKCDLCQNWTEGEHCEICRPGSYGNATANEGCKPCMCNGHGNQELGICDRKTGDCFCKDNTAGTRCEKCIQKYYGDPQEGGQCWFQCEPRGMLTDISVKQGIGSYQSYRNPWGGPEARECLWLIAPNDIKVEPLVQIQIEWESLNIDCDENAVYIYDNLPDLTGNGQQGQLIAVVCGPYSSHSIIETRSKHVTIHYKKGGDKDSGFNAIYFLRSCSNGTCLHPHVCDEFQRCVCPFDRVGPRCETQICPNNCSSKVKQGFCDKGYGRCVCNEGYAGNDCSTKILHHHLAVNDLFNTNLLSDSFEHLRKTIPRFGHSLSADKRGSLWMFGGYSLSNGPLNDIRQFDTKNGTWMQVTVESTPEAKMPLGRYFHGAEIYLSKQTIYIYGGLTSLDKGKPNRILGDFWQFSIQNQKWDEIEIKTLIKPPSLAGQTLTFVKMYDKESLLMIGGVSMNSTELHLWEYNLDGSRWEKLHSTGVKIPPLFGHSTVYHSSSQVVYVFGGFANGHIQKTLYALNMHIMQWTELPIFAEQNMPDNHLPRSRYFHSAATTENYMIIYGGRTFPYNASDNLLVYVYECNHWIRLTEDVHLIGADLPEYTYAEAMAIDQESKLLYLVGGWDGTSQTRVIRIQLPEDICEFWSTGKSICRQFMGCSYCSLVSPQVPNDFSGNTTEPRKSFCFTSGEEDVCQNLHGAWSINNGEICDDVWISKRNCSSFSTCTTCLSTWPSHTESTPVCQWCDGCGIEGRCLPNGMDCEKGTSYCAKHTSVGSLIQCPLQPCHTLDCENCIQYDKCVWALQNDIGVTKCTNRDLVERNGYKIMEKCPEKCENFSDCTSCLDSTDSENPKYCQWSTNLQACLNPKHLPIFCAGGICGLVLDSLEANLCPEPCSAYKQCSTCTRHGHCGWCSRDNYNGDGICTEGSLENVSPYDADITTCDVIYMHQKNMSYNEIEGDKFSWNFIKCPPENECLNSHHNCDRISQRCVDSYFGYECKCADGYKNNGGVCIPVCNQGCVRGRCILPDKCECDFGYVGANCSIQCQCNGHSNCAGPDKLDECSQCHNNTMGSQCEKCKPLFVGNPKENGRCVPCFEYCNHHTDLCVTEAETPVRNMTRLDLLKMLKEGPIGNATCLKCSNQTAGERCETCITGYFRGTDNESDACRLCECHGHGNICDPITGEKCNCGNNTESDATCIAGNGKNSAQQCWALQCSKCRDSYAGNPIDGHQCYKQISVEVRMCFDALPIEQCKLKPSPLKPGHTVFFVIQPRFMNVDIRITIDVTQGELDVFMSPQDDSFVVLTNQSSGYHDIYLDSKYRWEQKSKLADLNIEPRYGNYSSEFHVEDLHKLWPPSIRDCKSLNGDGFYVSDAKAKDLSTYITLNQCNSLLRLFNLKNRLVLTLPQNAHNLSATRFFIALRSSPGAEHSYGSIVFRQDQLHIDLFVFFSVFFSCFFLFLAICVVAWKFKQAADIRRARRRHHVEMLHMAQRPFASITVAIPQENEIEQMEIQQIPTPVQMRRHRGRSKSTSASTSFMHSQSSSIATSSNRLANVRPIAIEPTADNVAAVGTVFISLPGKNLSPVSIALGSALITLPRNYPMISRSRPRRGSHPPILQAPPAQQIQRPQF